MPMNLLSTALVVLAVGSAGVGQEAGRSAAQKTPAVAAPSPIAADVKPSAGSQALRPADVRDWKGFARRLEVMGEADLLPTSAVWKSLSADAKAATKRIARAGTPDAADQRVLLESVNAWIAGKSGASDATLKAENIRDLEIQSLLKKPNATLAEIQRLNRLFVETMFPLELVQQPLQVATNEGANVSRYPPNHLPEVTLSLTVPNLRGRLKLFLPNQETLVVSGEKPVTIKVPNDGLLRFAIPGDEYDQPFPRTVDWTDDDVKNGVVEKSLPLLKGRRKP
jgi:hypothetical protein